MKVKYTAIGNRTFVQMVCNSKLEILNVVARWPGSVHDATIFNNCALKHNLENTPSFRNCFLLGKVSMKHIGSHCTISNCRR